MKPLQLTLVLLSITATVWSQTSGKQPNYVRRLEMPIRNDSFAQPGAVLADLHTGEVFVCDRLNNRIVIFDSSGNLRYQIAGGDVFRAPMDMAVDPDGYIFVVGQTGGGIKLLDFDGRFIREVPLTGLPAGTAEPTIPSFAISRSGHRLYVLDVRNDRLWIADREGAVLNSVDLTANRLQEEIDELRYGHVDIYDDTILLPIPTDGLVHLFDLDGRSRGTVGVRGSAECQTMFPVAAALDDRGRVIILDQQRALFMTWDLERGACLSEHYGFGNAPGYFYQPSDLALDAEGRLYISQGFEGRIQVYEGAQPASL